MTDNHVLHPDIYMGAFFVVIVGGLQWIKEI